MHGRPRNYKHKLKDPKAQEGYKKKVDAIRDGTALILQCRKARRYDDAVLDASAKLLKVVPEIYTLWNFRREALVPIFEAGGEAAQKASAQELALTQACLLENPKSYSTWHHRKWVVARGHADLQAELKLVAKALDADDRNFHAWAYRQFVVRLSGTSLQEELGYSEEKIAQNFSNYSAWHYRSILLHRLHCTPLSDAMASSITQQLQSLTMSGTAAATTNQKQGQEEAQQTPGVQQQQAQGGGGEGAPETTFSPVGNFQGTATQRAPIPTEVLDEEYDMVHQAFATDSKDQSPWMYYRWLVGNSLAHLEVQGRSEEEQQAARATLEAVLSREVERLEVDHLSADPDAKWPLLTLARLKEAQARLGLTGGRPVDQVAAEARGSYERLVTLDPMRAGYYKDALRGKAFVVVSALGTV